MPVQPLRRLVPPTVYDEPQPYFIYGGFAFLGLTEAYLHEWGDEWQADAPQDLVHLTLTGVPKCAPPARDMSMRGITAIFTRVSACTSGHRVACAEATARDTPMLRNEESVPTGRHGSLTCHMWSRAMSVSLPERGRRM